MRRELRRPTIVIAQDLSNVLHLTMGPDRLATIGTLSHDFGTTRLQLRRDLAKEHAHAAPTDILGYAVMRMPLDNEIRH